MLNFLIKSILLGVGLAMDAFSVSIVNGLNEPHMRRRKQVAIASTFAFFQFIMPLIGWISVRTVANAFEAFQKFIPWIALVLLTYIGGKMLFEGVREAVKSNEEKMQDLENEAAEINRLGKNALIIQGIATSIDALSVGFTISDYHLDKAFVCCLIIAVVTYLICAVGLRFGKKFGEKLSDKANILGGVILILIGLEICFF